MEIILVHNITNFLSHNYNIICEITQWILQDLDFFLFHILIKRTANSHFFS